MRARSVLLPGVALALALAQPCRAVDNLASQERLGVRVGYVETFDELYSYYGPGWDLTLSFNERLMSRLYLDVRVGAIYLGDLLDPALDDYILDVFGIIPINTEFDDVESEMRMFTFSVGLIYGIPIGASAYTMTVSAAGAIYSVSVAFASDFVADDLSDQYFGASGGLGLARRVGTNWSLEANATVNYFSTDEGVDDLFWVFTEGMGQDPLLLGFSLGVVVDLR